MPGGKRGEGIDAIMGPHAHDLIASQRPDSITLGSGPQRMNFGETQTRSPKQVVPGCGGLSGWRALSSPGRLPGGGGLEEGQPGPQSPGLELGWGEALPRPEVPA